jgi:PAS domain S-box-containing protein
MALMDTEDRRTAAARTGQRGQQACVEALSFRAEQAEEELARFFEQSFDLQCVAGLDGYFKRLNPAWTNRFGWTLEELTATPYLDFVHPDDREATTAHIDRLAAGTPTIPFENQYRHRDGSYRWLQWNARLATGRPFIYATARDVTRKKWLERQLIEVADREKERMGRELHDGLCQSLAGVAALSATLSKNLAANSEPAASAAATEIAALLNEIIGQVRDLARGLGPVDLNEKNIAGALEVLALNVKHLFNVSCSIECDDPVVGLPDEIKLHLLRIAQEAVRNAVAHGRAGRIEIGLSRKGGKGVLSIRDNGVGIPEGAPNVEGIGLHTMAARARLIGGSLKVGQCTPQGTVVICAFPLPELPSTRDRRNHVRSDT